MDQKTHFALRDFMTEINKLNDEKEIGERLLSFFHEMGFEGGNIWYACGIDENDTVNSPASSYPPELLDMMYSNPANNQAAIPSQVAESTLPIRIDWAHESKRYENGSVDHKRTQEFITKLGLTYSMIIPIPVPGKRGASGASVYSKLSNIEFDQLLSEKQLALQISAYAVHFRMQSLRD